MAETPITCSACSTPSPNLKNCAKCKTTAYCNRASQKTHWQSHKKDCNASATTQSRADDKPFTAISKGTFLQERSEEQTFRILIDALRLREEDVYNVEQVAVAGTIYEGEGSSEGALRGFWGRRRGWRGSCRRVDACIQFGLQDEDFSPYDAQKKSDIVETWKDDRMPMKLRMLAEKVYGSAPDGVKGDHMLPMMVSSEAGMGPRYMKKIDVAPALGRNPRA
ncbi:hypothetical protein M409DRAFT_54827 [Zasmidium cellare ATCC 36951]|uniref:MYND-type domain-containing protein n=1 Tax=Zasmidium cellare ATCC 36951 TaxID=1080233 RepID=A0A6A6CH53_ZASCE|nr:uncharacterized protein M409DRAFT_54827 [Zasmidium cellare ATCC 36951]KAF2166485.1 hypothetical protein M409DRAFT_54827 [Zasmidium cellare ATCC 36951]